MDKINKYQTVIIILAVIIGLLFGHFDLAAQYSSNLIVPLLMTMLFGLFLSLDLKKLRSSFLNLKFSVSNIIINFIWTPIFAYILGSIFLSQELALWIGFVMLMVTPCTDWYLVFTGVAKGNVSLSTAILPVNLILQVVLLPIYLMIFFGETGNIELASIVKSILLVLVVPFVLALLAKKVILYKNNSLTGSIHFFTKSQVIFLALAVVAMFASEGKNLTDNPNIIYILLIPFLVFFTVTFVLAQLVSRILTFNYEDKVSLTMTTMARNSPISLAIAVAAFPEQPLIALSLIIGPLIELPVLVIAAQLLLKRKK